MLLHFTIGASILSRKSNLLSVFKSPVLLATLAGLTVNLINVELWEPAAETLDLLGQAAIPLLLFTLGVRLIGVNFSDWKLGALGAVLCPLSGLVIALLMVRLFGLEGLLCQQLILFSVLPPAVLNHMMAEKYQQQPQTVASIVLMGNMGSLIVLPITLFFIL
ncbi:MAG TPA: hypothetical protein EYG22_04280 [Candidatus Thioglobus sp.]|nr:hypothetical protein [Candidatus Thioglobus sp.]